MTEPRIQPRFPQWLSDMYGHLFRMRYDYSLKETVLVIGWCDKAYDGVRQKSRRILTAALSSAIDFGLSPQFSSLYYAMV